MKAVYKKRVLRIVRRLKLFEKGIEKLKGVSPSPQREKKKGKKKLSLQVGVKKYFVFLNRDKRLFQCKTSEALQ